MGESFDAVVVGAGMAGASLAAHLAGALKVLLLETEPRAGVHATGRSAALYAPSYGSGPVRVLTQASRSAFFDALPDGNGEPFVKPRPTLTVAPADRLSGLDAAYAADPGMFERLGAAEVEDLVPIFKPGRIAGGLVDHSSADIDVDALHQSYLKTFRRRGGVFAPGERLAKA
jgi:D-arginine dehydrogenase